MNVLLLGGRGYVASTLLRILVRHPEVSRITVCSEGAAGREIALDHPALCKKELEKLEKPTYESTESALTRDGFSAYTAVFSALPHGVLARNPACMEAFEKTTPLGAGAGTGAGINAEAGEIGAEAGEIGASRVPVLIDLSADFRLKDSNMYQTYYGFEHANTGLLTQSCFGLSEWYRSGLQKACLIANPGCYSSSALLPLLPVLRGCTVEGLIQINSISGISGAGRKLEASLLFCEQEENVSAYKSGTQHRHVPEMLQELSRLGHQDVSLVFNPHMAPLSQGMLTTITVPLPSVEESKRARDALFAQYLDETFIRVLQDKDVEDRSFGTRAVQRTNLALIYARCEKNCIIIHCAIDNLWKGAAGQAVHNFNIRFGFEESAGLV